MHDNTYSLHFRFFALNFFANLFHHLKCDHPQDDIVLSIKDFMLNYVTTTHYLLIHQHMQEKRYYWSTFIPFLSLCYSPSAHLPNDGTDKLELHLLCVKSGLLSMKCMCIADNANDVIAHEGLLDFITCLPWFMPNEETTSDAMELMQIAQQSLQLHIPSLTNIVKAFLASHYCGLDKLLNCDIHSILNDITF